MYRVWPPIKKPSPAKYTRYVRYFWFPRRPSFKSSPARGLNDLVSDLPEVGEQPSVPFVNPRCEIFVDIARRSNFNFHHISVRQNHRAKDADN